MLLKSRIFSTVKDYLRYLFPLDLKSRRQYIYNISLFIAI